MHIMHVNISRCPNVFSNLSLPALHNFTNAKQPEIQVN